MPPVPSTDTMLSTFNTTTSTITSIRLSVEIFSSGGFARSAAAGNLAFMASAVARGSSMSRNSDRAIFAASTDTPGNKIGRTSGR